MAVKLNQSEKDLIKDRRFMRRVAHGYEMQIAPGVWLKGAFLAQGQDRFIVDADRLRAGIGAALASLDSQDDANFAAAALLRLKTAGVDLGDARLRVALAGSPYALTLLAALDAGVSDFDGVKWGQGGVVGAPAGTDAAFLLGSGGADRLTGTAGDDTLAGNRGDDRLVGGAGNDTYLFSAGDGRDTIDDSFVGAGSAGDRDTIRFGAGITPAMIGFQRVGQDLVLSFEGSDDRITIAGWGSSKANHIERFEFADGTVWDAGDLAGFVRATAPAGTAGDDVLEGWNGADDLLAGGAGDDRLSGLDGADFLNGGAGNDILDGGRGNDYLDGGTGADTYLFERGAGRDTIRDLGDANDGPDTIRFGAGIAAGDIVLRRDSRGLVFEIAGTDDRITVSGWGRDARYRIERVEFADGTVWQAADLQARIAALPLTSSAGDGDDLVQGWLGFDETLRGLGGDDTLMGGDGNDSLEGGAGDDYLIGGAGSDVYHFALGDGRDTISDYDANPSQDTIRFGAGITAADVVVARAGNDLVFKVGADGDSITVTSWAQGAQHRIERVEFADGSAWDSEELRTRVRGLPQVGTDGDDYLAGDEEDNVLAGGRGNDTLTGGTGSDTYLFERGDGQDIVQEYGYGLDVIRFGAGIGAGDIHLSRIGNDLVLAIAGSDDRITVRNWASGEWSRVEQVAFADGTVWDAAALAAMVAALPMIGTAGDDVLNGDANANILAGGTGNDTLYGGAGGDTYLFERGDGHDTIQDWDWTNADADIIRFGEGIAAADVTLRRSADGIVFEVAGGSDSITVLGWSRGQMYRIEQVAFSDGTVWNAADLAAMVAGLPVLGTEGNDTLVGDEHANAIDGGAGNDVLQGGNGGDTYLFERGDGQDSIEEGGAGDPDTLRFGAGIDAGDIRLSRSGNDLVFAVAGSDDRVTVRNWGFGAWYRIEQVAFADGTVWDEATLAAMIAAVPFTGTAGNDFLHGDDGANIFDGGAGNDTLQGGYGSDTYLFGRGDGHDMIQEWDWDTGSIDTIRFGAGIAPVDLVLRRSGNDIVFEIAGGNDSITVQGWRHGPQYRIEQAVFADGTVWDAAALAAMVAAIPIEGTDGDDVLRGDDGANALHGGAGNDTLSGGVGADTYLFERGDGQDSIEEFGFDVDTIRFGAGIGAGDVVFSRSGSDLVLVLAGTDDRITVRNWSAGDFYRVEQVAFADGTVWDAAELAARVAAIPVAGTDGDDVLSGDAGPNTFDGGAGNDTLLGDSGADTYLFERGDGQDRIEEGGNDIDTIRFGPGIDAGDIRLSRSGGDLVFAVAGSEDRITVRNWRYGDWYRVEQVAFADGTVWDAETLAAMVAALPFAGTDGDDSVAGDDAANVLIGGAGNDTLLGGYGADTYLFERGDGQDSIEEEGYDLDTIRFGAGIGAGDIRLSRSGNDLVFAVAGSEDRVTVRNWRHGDWYRVEQVAFADGTVWDAAALAALVEALPLLGTDGDDVLSGGDGADILAGGAGNDTLLGGYGADTYLFERGDGQDSIVEEGADLDTIRFGAGIDAADIRLSRSGNDLVFAVAGSDDRITVSNWRYGSYYRVEQVAFADGSVWDAAALAAMAEALPFVGSDGDDAVYGDEAANLLDGGAGNDVLQGGYGADTYLFERGDGQDSIEEAGYDVDTIRFGEGIGAGDIRLARSGSDLVIALAGSDDRITVRNWRYGQEYRIEQLAFADDTVWDAAALAEMVAALPFTGTDGNDYVGGDDGANILEGGAGNDTLEGGYGGDTYLFGRGDGHDFIQEWDWDSGNTDTIRFGAGIAPADLVLRRSGNDIVFEIAGGNDSVTVQGWRNGPQYRIEQVAFADGTVWDAAALAAMVAAIPVEGTDGDDYLIGDDGANTFDGGAGNDTLLGGHGGDTYLFERGDGQDSIEEEGYDLDTIRFGAGIDAGDITLSRDGSDLVFAVAGGDDRVTVRNWRSSSYYRIEQVAFADGTVWDAAALAAMVEALPVAGSDGDDVLSGSDGADTFVGGAGNDILQGGDGDDTYLFGRGDGHDTIQETDWYGMSMDTIRFGAGIAAADVVLRRRADGIVFEIDGGSDSITVQSWGSGQQYRVEQVVFADGTVWDAAALEAMVAAVPIVGTDGDDYLSGDDGANIFDGGTGNDFLVGGSGADTYFFERGDGQDSIDDFGDDVDTIRFGEGIAAADIVVRREGDNLVLALAGSDDRVTVHNWAYGQSYRIEQVAFADGTVWDAAALTMLANVPLVGTDGDDYLVGSDEDNLFDGGAGNDILEGGFGEDTYLFERGDGQDSIVESGYEVDTLRFGAGIAAADIVISREGGDLVFAVAGTDDRVTVRDWAYGDWYRIEQVAFADGTVWDAAALAAMVAALPFVGTDGDDYLTGDGDDNVLDGGAGNDILQGGFGADSYLFERGDGQDSIDENGYDFDTIRFGAGIAAADIVVSREGRDLVFAVAGTEDRITVRNWGNGDWYRIEQVAFADGTVWDAAALRALANVPFVGTDGDDYLVGDGDDNLFDGGAGNDILQGEGGADTYLFELGDGQDRIHETGWDSDTIRFGAGIAASDIVVSREGEHLVFAVAGTDDRITVAYWNLGEYYRIDRIEFADGTAWDAAQLRSIVASLPLVGTAWDDNLYGDEGDNVLVGGAGNDYLNGGGGGDTYVFNRGDGQDIVLDFGDDAARPDVIRFGEGILEADISVSRYGSSLVFSIDGGDDRIEVFNWDYGDAYRIERVEFADGSSWDAAMIEAQIDLMGVAGAEGADVSHANEGADAIAQGEPSGLVEGRDQARLADAGLGGWALSSSLLAFSLHAGSEAVLGGESGVRFGAGGELSVYPADSAQALLASPEFGKPRQPV